MFRQRILYFSQNLIDKNNFWCSNQSLRQFQEPVRKKFNVSHFITNINTSFLYVSFLSSHVTRLNNVSKETRKKKRKEENPSSIITANCNDKGKRKNPIFYHRIIRRSWFVGLNKIHKKEWPSKGSPETTGFHGHKNPKASCIQIGHISRSMRALVVRGLFFINISVRGDRSRSHNSENYFFESKLFLSSQVQIRLGTNFLVKKKLNRVLKCTIIFLILKYFEDFDERILISH